MEIRNPKFELGQKVRDIEYGDIYTVVEINRYSFSGNEYWYELETDRKKYTCTRPELEPYVEKPKTIWDLKDRDTYYVIDYDAMNVRGVMFFDDTDDINYRALGNCFLTREEAEFEIERRKIETEMLRLGGRRNIKIDICDDNYYIMYDNKTRNLAYFNRNWMHSQGSIFFDTYVDVDKAVKAIGEDRIKKYIFGVE